MIPTATEARIAIATVPTRTLTVQPANKNSGSFASHYVTAAPLPKIADDKVAATARGCAPQFAQYGRQRHLPVKNIQ
jgi:hypothetical protein